MDAQGADEDGAKTRGDLVAGRLANSRIIRRMMGDANRRLPHAALGADFRAGADGFAAFMTVLFIWPFVTSRLTEVGCSRRRGRRHIELVAARRTLYRASRRGVLKQLLTGRACKLDHDRHPGVRDGAMIYSFLS
jgi:hypothetical protein